MKYRRNIELVADVLFASLRCPKKTHIMNYCNMNSKQLNMYLNMLITSGLLSFNPAIASYTVTAQGELFLKLFKVYKQHLLQAKKKLAVVREERSQLEHMYSSLNGPENERYSVESQKPNEALSA